MAASKENPWGLASTSTPSSGSTASPLTAIQQEQSAKSRQEEKLRKKKEEEARKQQQKQEEKSKNPWAANVPRVAPTPGSTKSLSEILKVHRAFWRSLTGIGRGRTT